MQKVSISRLSPGVKLAKDLYSYGGQLLLPRGTVLQEAHLATFRRQGLECVYVLESAPRTSKKERPFDDVYLGSLDTVKGFMMEAKLGRPLERGEIEDTVNLLLDQVFDEVDIFRQLRLMKEKDDYLFTHSVNVSLLSILIARWLKCEEEEIRQLGICGLLHDIGKVSIPNEILSKPGQLTEEEFETIKRHTITGYNMVYELEWVTPDVANAVLMHHERSNGSGYPLGTKGEEIGFFPRVVAVADVYDAITSQRSYSTKKSPYKAAEILWEESFGKLDPRISKVFYDRVSNFFVGNQVKLSNGQTGMVVYINPSLPTRPVVQVGDQFFDLARDRSVTITEIVD